MVVKLQSSSIDMTKALCTSATPPLAPCTPHQPKKENQSNGTPSKTTIQPISHTIKQDPKTKDERNSVNRTKEEKKKGKADHVGAK